MCAIPREQNARVESHALSSEVLFARTCPRRAVLDHQFSLNRKDQPARANVMCVRVQSFRVWMCDAKGWRFSLVLFASRINRPRSDAHSFLNERRTIWCSSVENRVDEGLAGIFFKMLMVILVFGVQHYKSRKICYELNSRAWWTLSWIKFSSVVNLELN